MDEQLPLDLPGVTVESTPRGGITELESQVRRSLTYMAEQGLVDARHAGLMQLALELARVIRPGERAYGVAQAAAQLLATWDRLLPADGGGVPDGFDELRAYLQGVDAGRGPA